MIEQLPVAVLGANGRMGAEAVKAVESAPDMKLVAALGRGDSLTSLTDAGARFVVDLTVPEQVDNRLDSHVSDLPPQRPRTRRPARHR